MSEKKIIDTSLVLDILVAEKDYIKTWKPDLDLFHKTYKNGKFIYEKIGEQWRPEVNEVLKEMFRKRKLRYSMCFLESFRYLSYMKPYTIKVLVYLVTNMRRDNWIRQLSTTRISEDTGVSKRYVVDGLRQLLDMDVVRRSKSGNTYDYIVSPAFFTRASFRSLFTITDAYSAVADESLPKYSFSNFRENF